MCMKMFTSWMLALALIAVACSGGSEDSSESTTSSSLSDTNDDRVLSSDDDAEPSGQVSAIWVPSSLALVDFVGIELAEDSLGIDAVEGDATYGEIEDAAAVALDDGMAVLVPSTIGARLVEGGATVHAKLFESDDPEEAISQLGLWLVADLSVADDVSTSRGGIQVQTVAFGLGQVNDGGADVDIAGETLTIAGEEAEAVLDSKVQTAAFETGAAVVEELAEKYGARAGGSVGARTVAKAAGPVAAVLDFMYTMYQFEEAASEMIEAESRARTAAYETGMTAVAMLSDAHRRLCALEAPLISGELAPNDAQELIDAMFSSAQRAVNVGSASARDLEELGGEDAAAQIDQLIDSRDEQLQDKILEMTRLVAEQSDRPSGTFVSEPVTSVLQEALDRESSDRAIAGALDAIFSDPEPGNESMHSDGVLTVTSEGETDIIRHGQFWYAPGVGGPGLDDLFPCGPGSGRTTLCGDIPQNTGTFTVVIAEFGGMVPLGPTDRLYQYGFVFDLNGDTTDNYRASSSFPYDTWDNTDFWVEISGGPSGLGFNVTDATRFEHLGTGGRAVLAGNTIALFMPQAELSGGPDEPAVRYRTTSFSHSGDFGINPPHDFNIDSSPRVHETLALPPDLVKLNGPGTPPGPSFDGGPMNELHDTIVSGFGGFQPGSPSVDDPTSLDETPECWATRQVFDDPTELGQRRSMFSYDDTLIDVRITTHDSESAARGSARFRHLGVNGRCRDALIAGATQSNDITSTPRYENDHGSVIVTDFTADGSGFESTSGAFHHGSLTVRFSIIGQGDTSMVIDHVFESINDAFATVP